MSPSKAFPRRQIKNTLISQTKGPLTEVKIDTTYSRKQQSTTGSDISLSEATGRLFPDDWEPGAQSEDLRSGGVAHAILCFQIRRILHVGYLHVTILPISSPERDRGRTNAYRRRKLVATIDGSL
jgi:hypothetical protein